MQWLMWAGAAVFVPVNHSPDWDLVAELDGRLLRIQVKTSGCAHKAGWQVAVCTRGGNQSWNGIAKRFAASRCDYLFVHAADGRRWFIPSSAVGGSTSIVVGNAKYGEYEIERGHPFPDWRSETSPLNSTTDRRGDARAVKGNAL